MRSLFDVSALIAAFDAGHVKHGRMMRWWAAEHRHGWATCPLTENGYVRISSQRSCPRPVPLPDAVSTLRKQIAVGGHVFWPDDPSILDAGVIDHSRLLGPRRITISTCWRWRSGTAADW